MGRVSKTLDRLRVPKTFTLQRYVVFSNARLLLLRVFLDLLAFAWYIAIFIENVDLRTDEIPVETRLTISLSTQATYAAFHNSFNTTTHTACNSNGTAQEFGRSWIVERTCTGRCSWQDFASDTCEGRVSEVDLVSSISSTSSFIVLSRSEFDISNAKIHRYLYPGAQAAIYEFRYTFQRMSSIHLRLAGAGLARDRAESGAIDGTAVIVLGKDGNPWRTYDSQSHISLSALTIITELIPGLPDSSQNEMPTETFDKGMEIRSTASCWFTVRDIRNFFGSDWPEGSWSETASVDHPTCIVNFNWVGFDGVQWESMDRPRNSRHENRGLRITATKVSTLDRILSPSKLIMNMVLMFILLIVPHYVVLTVALNCLGLLSRIYKKAIVENFDMVGRVSSLAFELMSSTVLFLKMIDRAAGSHHDEGAGILTLGDRLADGAISRGRIKERLHRTLQNTELHKWQIDSFADFCFKEFARVRRRRPASTVALALSETTVATGAASAATGESTESEGSESAESIVDSQESDELPRLSHNDHTDAVHAMATYTTHSAGSMQHLDDYSFDFVFRILFRRFTGGFESVLALFAKEAKNPMEWLFKPAELTTESAVGYTTTMAGHSESERRFQGLGQDTASVAAHPHLGLSAANAFTKVEEERDMNRKARHSVVRLQQKQQELEKELETIEETHKNTLVRMEKLRVLIHDSGFQVDNVVRDFENSSVARASAKARLTSPRAGMMESTAASILEAQELVDTAEKEASDAKEKATKAKLRSQEAAAEIRRNIARLRERVDLAVARRQQEAGRAAGPQSQDSLSEEASFGAGELTL